MRIPLSPPRSENVLAESFHAQRFAAKPYRFLDAGWVEKAAGNQPLGEGPIPCSSQLLAA